jgi:alpha-L-fucosidase
MKILEGIASWMQVNGSAIYGTRPWTVYGEGPSMKAKQEKGWFAGLKDVRAYKPGDLRFTKKDNKLYVFAMEHPESDITVESLTGAQKVKSVKMLGMKSKIKWTQAANGQLTIKKSDSYPSYPTVVYEVNNINKRLTCNTMK